jgi:tRNA A37 threonylcarbamoyladenosine dehydratase
MQIEGVTYEVEWKHFKKGMSFFVPCLDPKRAKAQLMVVTKRLKLKVLTKAVIEDGIRGLRVWRL